MVELKVRLGAKGQIVIPKILRDKYKLYPKNEVIIKEDKDGIIIKKPDDNLIEKLREIAKSINMKKIDLSPKNLKKLRDEQYEKRARRAGIRV